MSTCLLILREAPWPFPAHLGACPLIWAGSRCSWATAKNLPGLHQSPECCQAQLLQVQLALTPTPCAFHSRVVHRSQEDARKLVLKWLDDLFSCLLGLFKLLIASDCFLAPVLVFPMYVGGGLPPLALQRSTNSPH